MKFNYWISDDQELKNTFDSKLVRFISGWNLLDFEPNILRNDTVCPDQFNYYIIPYPDENDVTDFLNCYLTDIKYCNTMDIEVVIDRSWEFLYDHMYVDIIKFQNDHDIKAMTIITNNSDEIKDKNVIDINFFAKHESLFLHKYMDMLDLKLCPHEDIEKKYLFTCLFGNINKIPRILLYAGLEYHGLLNDSFISKFYRFDNYHQPEYIINRKHLSPNYVQYIEDNHDDIMSEKRFDTDFNDKILFGFNDRRVPIEFHESYFNIVVETNNKYNFYTEKTYKPIICKIPFIINGAFHTNSIFKKVYKYEIFDEIFDYSFEIPTDMSLKDMWEFEYNRKFVDEIRRVSKEPKSIFTQKSVIEKLEYNYNLFHQQNTKDNISSEMKTMLLDTIGHIQ